MMYNGVLKGFVKQSVVESYLMVNDSSIIKIGIKVSPITHEFGTIHILPCFAK